MQSENVIQQISSEVKTSEMQHTSKREKILLFIGFLVVLFVGVAIGFYAAKNKDTLLPESTNNKNNKQSGMSLNTNVYTGSIKSLTPYPTVSLTALPLGDNKYTTTAAKKGYIYLCRVMSGGGGAQESGSWITGTTWNFQEKPHVQGTISWPNATFSNQVTGNNRVLTGNGLPVGMTTGTFPISSADPASQYDRNPNSIKAQTLNLTLPVNPTVSSTPNCMGGEVGVMLNGVPLFNGFDAEDRDAAAHEIQDSCDGHPEVTSEYHYHSLSSCFKDIKESTVLGFALDGFPITGPVRSDGTYLTTEALDECHGTTSTINLAGKQLTMYHYVMTQDFPYSVSCFKAKPVSLQVIPQNGARSQGAGGQQGQNGFGRPPAPSGQLPPPGQPQIGQ